MYNCIVQQYKPKFEARHAFQDSYKIYETEDDMYTVSAAVYTPETVHMDDEGGCILEQVPPEPSSGDGAVQVLDHHKSKPSRLVKRNKR